MITAAGDQASQHMLFLLHILQFNNISYNYTLLQAVMSEARSELFFGGGGGFGGCAAPKCFTDLQDALVFL